MLILTMIVISMLLMLIARVTMTIQVCTWNHTVSKVFNNEQVESGLLALSLPCWHLLRIREMDEGVLHLGFYMDVRQTSAPPTPSTRINRPMSSALSHQCHPMAIPRYWSIVGFHCTAGHSFCRSAVSPSELKSNHTTDAGWSKNWMDMDEYDKHTRQFPDFSTRNLFVIEIEVVLESFFSFHKPSNLSMKCLESILCTHLCKRCKTRFFVSLSSYESWQGKAMGLSMGLGLVASSLPTRRNMLDTHPQQEHIDNYLSFWQPSFKRIIGSKSKECLRTFIKLPRCKLQITRPTSWVCHKLLSKDIKRLLFATAILYLQMNPLESQCRMKSRKHIANTNQRANSTNTTTRICVGRTPNTLWLFCKDVRKSDSKIKCSKHFKSTEQWQQLKQVL